MKVDFYTRSGLYTPYSAPDGFGEPIVRQLRSEISIG
jgi:hypothetical protein